MTDLPRCIASHRIASWALIVRRHGVVNVGNRRDTKSEDDMSCRDAFRLDGVCWLAHLEQREGKGAMEWSWDTVDCSHDHDHDGYQHAALRSGLAPMQALVS